VIGVLSYTDHTFLLHFISTLLNNICMWYIYSAVDPETPENLKIHVIIVYKQHVTILV